MDINLSRPQTGVYVLFCLSVAVLVGIVLFNSNPVRGQICPLAAIDHTYNDANDTLVLEHDDGSFLGGKVTVVVTDNETNDTESVVWLPENSTAAIRTGDSIWINDREGDQPVRAPWIPFDLGKGDRVHVRNEVERGDTTESCSISNFTI